MRNMKIHADNSAKHLNIMENYLELKNSTIEEVKIEKEKILEDGFRVEYFRGYVTAMAEAVGIDGVDVRGYMAWSLME